MGIKFFIILLIVVLGAGLAGFLYFSRFAGTQKKAVLEVGGTKFSVDIAGNFVSRAKGLSGREKLQEGEGMFFIFGSVDNHGFWMKGMKFPIDIIWIKNNKIVGITPNVEPQAGVSDFGLKLYYPPEPVNKVLEINAGEAERRGLGIGDFVTF